MGVITFGGVSSSTYGIEVETYPDYSVPEKKYEIIHVPGHNGDFLIDTGEYSNVIKKYSISLSNTEAFKVPDNDPNNYSVLRRNTTGTYSDICNRLSEWLHRNNGYLRLSDDYDPAHFRYAVCTKEVGLTNIFNEGGKATIEFNCKPQRFLYYWKINDTTYWENSWITLSSNGTIINPTVFDSRPLIRITGSSGTVTITTSDSRTYPMVIASHSGQLYIDCDLMDCYSGSNPPTNQNGVVTMTNGFPLLGPGSNSIALTGSISSVEVKPRFWTL